jgi:hypothetical protein
MRDEQDEEEEVLLEASRIAQKIKSEIGPRSKQYDEVDFPTPPPMVMSLPVASTSTLPMLPSLPSIGAAPALQAFEQRKKAMQTNAAKKAPMSNGKRASSSSSSSSSDNSSSSDSSSSDSSSSSSSSSSFSSSSSDDSSSESDSTSSSDSESDSSSSSSDPQEIAARKQNGSIDWVPPGHGLARTQRNNRSRRQKRKAEEEERQIKLFEEAKTRAEKRAKGEAVDEDAATEGWMIDTKGKKLNGHANNTQRYKVVSRDADLVLPPGGGSLGILQKKVSSNGSAARQTLKGTSNGTAKQTLEQGQRFVPAVREAAQETIAAPDETMEDVSTSFRSSRVPPPPSQRKTPIPAGVRLTSIDCDNCYNGQESEAALDKDIEDVNEAYEAFQARAKASLQAAKEEEEKEEEEQEALQRRKQKTRLDLAEAHWLDDRQADDGDGGDSHYVDDSESIDEDVEDEIDLDMAQSFMSELPVEFGKKSDWDGNDVVVPRQAQLVQPNNGLVELDYGEPEEPLKPSTSLHEDLKRLRDLRDQTMAAKVGRRPDESDALQKARMIALASRKKAK